MNETTTTPRLDLDDPLVRRMVEFNHTPREEWTVAGVLFAVRCDTCGHAWPCDTVNELRAKGSA